MGTPDGSVQGPAAGPVEGRASEAAVAAAAGRPPLALELLVHGVGGTTPEAMLQDPHIVRITGDATAGTYRRWHDRDAEQRPRPSEPVVPEAYSWANLTSGSAGRALWLLLLPFMVVNLAHWMRPARRPPDSPARQTAADASYDLLVRLAALLLTVLFTAAVCEIALDLTAWQCAGSAWCAAHKSWLGFLAVAHGGWWSQPGRRLAVGAALPLALVGLLWWLSHLTWSAYESQRMAPHGQPRADALPMEQPGFWYGRRQVGRLRIAHVTAALLTVAGALTVPALRADRAAGSTLREALGWALIVLLGLLAAGTGGILGRSWRCERLMDDQPERPVVRALHWTALGTLLAAALYAGWSRPGWHSSGRLPGSAGVFTLLVVGQLLLVLLLVAVTAVLGRGAPRRRPPDPVVLPGPGDAVQPTDEGFGGPDGPALGRFAGPATAMLALGLGSLLTAGAAMWTAGWLARGATPGGPGVALIGPPLVLTWHASVVPVLAVLLAVHIAVLAVRLLRRRAALEPQVETAYGVRGAGSPARTAQIATALARAPLTEEGTPVIGVLAALSFCTAAGTLAGAEITHTIPSTAARHAPTVLAYLADTAQSLGGWAVAALMVALVGLGRAAYQNLATRRTVGVLWDIGTFWPRAAHPFAPPCYAERAVPDLVWRMRDWLDADPDRSLVLSGHSQGTVLAAAAIWQLDRATRRRVALLTYGSPLRRLYGRYFPAFMGPTDLTRLRAEAPAWRNLFRVTDPIGGPVRVDGVDALFTDPLTYDRHLPGSPLPDPIYRHSDYWADPRYARERATVLTEVQPHSPGREA